jgi:hypothetical protein
MTADTTTKVSSFAAIALTVALVSGFAFSAATLAVALERVAALDVESNGIAYMSASHKVRCIMPPAQQKYCGVE